MRACAPRTEQGGADDSRLSSATVAPASREAPRASSESTDRVPSLGRRDLAGLIAAAAIVAAVALALGPVTPQIEFNRGLGFDGIVYADMVAAMRGQSTGALLTEAPPYAYRPVAPALVAWSGLDVSRGFLLLNVSSFILSGPLVFLLLRRYGAATSAGLLGVFWWATLPAGLRYAIYDPVLTDGVGLLFMFGVLVAIAYRMTTVFAAVLALGVLVRENLAIFAPFAWLSLLPLGWRKATALAGLAALPAAAAFIFVHVAPPIASPHAFDWLYFVAENCERLLGNAGGRAWRFAAAGVTSLGLVFALPILFARPSRDFVRSRSYWRYFVLASLAAMIAGGYDWDRYFLYFAPLLLILVFAVCVRTLSLRRAALLTLIQLIAVRFAWPLGASEADYLAYNVSTMDLSRLAVVAVLSCACVAASVAVVRWPISLGRPPAPALPTPVETAPTMSSAT
jgi:hypothetical protein